MSFIEFLEAFAHIAEKFAALPLEEDPNDWTETERIDQPLGEKISNLIELVHFL